MDKRLKFPGCKHICKDLEKELVVLSNQYRCGECKKDWVKEHKKSKTFRTDPKAHKFPIKTGAEILKYNK